MATKFDNYKIDGFFDEMMTADGSLRESYQFLRKRIDEISFDELLSRKSAAERALYNLGITFNVYGRDGEQEHIFPFDIIPRVITSEEWATLEAGLIQRITAMNLFIDDIYHGQKIIRDGIIPKELILSSKGYLKQCQGLEPPHSIWMHITGTDLIRNTDGQIYVLEDNLRCPSGVSYVLENRENMKRTFPEIFERLGVRTVYDYPIRLREMLQFLSNRENPTIGVLTPGIYNSAYFEHSFLARQMGIELIEGRDLVVNKDGVHMKTTKGLKRVDVVYRRLDDTFLDPLAFNPESLLGVPGIFECYRRGLVALANAPGTGVADDKVIYAFVPKIIKYYLDEDPIIPNVPTFICSDETDRKHVLENLDKLVVKAANEAGGYGMLIGPHSTKEERESFKEKILANPRNYIAQPTISLSRVPTIIGDTFEGRHVDLRPFILYGEKVYVMPGGLTRVALKQGSLVVNSSQGGGSKDTWVLQ